MSFSFSSTSATVRAGRRHPPPASPAAAPVLDWQGVVYELLLLEHVRDGARGEVPPAARLRRRDEPYRPAWGLPTPSSSSPSRPPTVRAVRSPPLPGSAGARSLTAPPGYSPPSPPPLLVAHA